MQILTRFLKLYFVSLVSNSHFVNSFLNSVTLRASILQSLEPSYLLSLISSAVYLFLFIVRILTNEFIYTTMPTTIYIIIQSRVYNV